MGPALRKRAFRPARAASTLAARSPSPRPGSVGSSLEHGRPRSLDGGCR